MCHEHKCLLIDQCPECKERLSWELKHRFICPCGHDYLQKKTPFGNMNPQNIKDLAILIDAIDIEQLIKVVNRIARPIDFLSARVPMNSQSIKDLFFLFAVATTYFFDNDYQKYFENTAKLKRNLQLTNNGFDDRCKIEAIEIPPIQNMINIDTTLHLRFRSANTDIVQLMALSRHQHYNWVVFSRRDYGREMSYEDLSNQCNTKQAAKLLFIPTQHIGTLINAGIISPLKGMRSTRDTLFDARSFKNLVVKTSTLGKPKSRISFQEILDKKHMDLFNASSYNLLQAVLLGDITAYADTQRDLITCVLFDREELNGYFERWMRNNSTEIYIKVVSKIFYINSSVIDNLVLKDLLEKSNSDDSLGLTITSKSLDEFKDKYYCLNRFSRLIGKRLDSVINLIAQSGVPIDFQYEGAYFISRSKKSTKVLNDILRNINMAN